MQTLEISLMQDSAQNNGTDTPDTEQPRQQINTGSTTVSDAGSAKVSPAPTGLEPMGN